MCGLASLYLPKNSAYISVADLLIQEILVVGQTRGMDATGLALHDVAQGSVTIAREPLKASEFVRISQIKEILKSSKKELCVITHNRLATNGSNAYIKNNQPIVKEDIACVQNGIVTNTDSLSLKHGLSFALDTYLILELFSKFLQEGCKTSEALHKLWNEIEGENTIVFQLSSEKKLIHTTNCGTLYYIHNDDIFLSCSERHVLQSIMNKFKISLPIQHLAPNQSLILDYNQNRLIQPTELDTHKEQSSKVKMLDLEDVFFNNLRDIKRCTQCILPETFPGITFDERGVCIHCQAHSSLKLKPQIELEEIFDRYRSKNGSPDCLVAFSGGRDSSYGMHLIKDKYKMNPVAYSYDWGMVTDLARRNQSRICGKLGIEHVWVSADIKFKRDNIRKNVNAWMSNPHVGMVPLFMVGDKTFLYHANRVMKNMGLNLIIFCPNNLERTNFKASYCGINASDFGDQVHHLKMSGKIKLLSFYAMQYLKNPRYINGSIADVVAGFLSYYVMKQDFLYLFDYENWDEKEIDELLKKEYDWEWDPNYPSSWRIGDGTAPFYNMIYFMHAGFTENDCFRSNQIREGVIGRDEALRRTQEENIPRFSEVEEYCKLICVNFVDLMNAIRKIRHVPSLAY